MTEMLEGRLLAKNIRETAKAQIEKMEEVPGMAVILVGENEASKLYVGLKKRAAKAVGIFIENIEFPVDVSNHDLIEKISELNVRDDIDGILVQFPLSNQDEDMVVGAIDPRKDIDGFHPVNLEKHQNHEDCIIPPVSLAIMKLIKSSNQPLQGKNAILVGNNEIFAHPLKILMEEQGIAMQFVKKDEGALSAKIRAADIIVVAVGKKNFITADMVKEGSIIIDVGTNKDGDKTVGDVSAEVEGKAGFLSPVPGGVGPLTVAYLLMNVIKASKK